MSNSPETEKKPAKSKKLLVIVIVLVLLLVVVGAGVVYVLSQRNAVDVDEEQGAAVPKSSEPAVVPTFLPVDTMVVNLADNGGERFAQIGITLELADAKTAERIKLHMPSIRSSILMLISQKTAEELLQREGKEALARDILREVSNPLGFEVADSTEASDAAAESEKSTGSKEKGQARNKPKKSPAALASNPVRKVLFSGFIVQ